MGEGHLQHQLGGQIEIVGIVSVGGQHQRQDVPRCALALPAQLDADLRARHTNANMCCIIDVAFYGL